MGFSPRWATREMLTIAAILDEINRRYGTTFALLDRYPAGEQDAFALRDATGAPFVLKWESDPAALAIYRRPRHMCDRLRALGYPTPRYAWLGRAPWGAYAIQQALPGQPLASLPLALVPQFLLLNACQAGLGRRAASSWPAPVIDPVLYGDDGFCLLEPMQSYSRATASLLRRVQERVRGHADLKYPMRDVVHFDCNPQNVLASAEGIPGAIDWDGWCYGDRMFDVATMLFYSYADVAVRDRLRQAVGGAVGPRIGGVYLMHLAHRQVDWSIRHHDPATIDHWLALATQVLDDISSLGRGRQTSLMQIQRTLRAER